MNDKEKPGQDAEVFVMAVKRKTRKYFDAEEKVRIVLEGMKRDVSVAELCRREGIPSAVYYSWTKDFMEGGKAQLQRDARRHADAGGVEKLKKENAPCATWWPTRRSPSVSLKKRSVRRTREVLP